VKAILARSATQPAGKKSSRGLTIGILGAKGGVGTTTLTVNLAAALLNEDDSNPVIADFRPGEGTMGLMLGYGRSQGMAKVLGTPPNEINPTVVENNMVQHQTGLNALVCSVRPMETQMDFNVESAIATINIMREMGQPALFDLGHGYNPVTARLQSEMDKLIVIVEPNSAALTMARELVHEISQNSGTGRINIVVLNRAQSSLQTPWQQVEETMGLTVKAIIAAAPELAYQSIEHAMPMVHLQPNATAASQMIKLAEEMKVRIKSLA
jgi:pilus assembly protein CpaE